MIRLGHSTTRKAEDSIFAKKRREDRQASVATSLLQRFDENATKRQRTDEKHEKHDSALAGGAIWPAAGVRERAGVELRGKFGGAAVADIKRQFQWWTV